MQDQITEPNQRTLAGLWIAGALLLLMALLTGCGAAQTADQPAAVVPASPAATPTAAVPALPPDAHQTALVAPKLYTYRVVNTYPHDPAAFTQGLIVRDGQFIEGTGQEGQSTLRRVAIESGEVLEQHPLDAQYFGEGITELGGKIYQLTWRNGTGFVYDAETLTQTATFAYGTEGWGITHDGERLIVSDGTPILQYWDPATLQPVSGVTVSLFGLPVPNINELEYIDGAIYANVWKTNLIMRIDPASGQVTGVIDLSGLLDYAPPATPTAAQVVSQPDVLNGIAYDEATGRLYVTGKRWPAVFAIELLEVGP